jgi:hypothetical protein
MSTKRIISLLLLLFGETLIIVGFRHFGRNLPSEVLALNIVVSSIIFVLYFIVKIIPWFNFKDISQIGIGSIGPRWFITFFYILLAIGAMIFFNTVEPIVIFATQIIVHSILLFLLLLGLFMAVSASGKVQDVFVEERQRFDRIDEMKKTTKEVQLKLNQMPNIPTDIITKMSEIQENLRFISPSNNYGAIELEGNFITQMKAVKNCLFESPLKFDIIIENIKNCENTYNERKQIYSN